MFFILFIYYLFKFHLYFILLFIINLYIYKKINEVGVWQRLVCQKREFAVRSFSCEV